MDCPVGVMGVVDGLCLFRGPVMAAEATDGISVCVFVATIQTVPDALGFFELLDVLIDTDFLAAGALIHS